MFSGLELFHIIGIIENSYVLIFITLHMISFIIIIKITLCLIVEKWNMFMKYSVLLLLSTVSHFPLT